MLIANSRHAMLLRERIERDYADFKVKTMQLDSGSIFELASTIAAVNDVHLYMITHDWADADETEYLLQSENPLMTLAEEWEAYKEDMGKDFGEMLTRLDAAWSDDYIPGTVAGEMRDDYGEEESFDTDDYY